MTRDEFLELSTKSILKALLVGVLTAIGYFTWGWNARAWETFGFLQWVGLSLGIITLGTLVQAGVYFMLPIMAHEYSNWRSQQRLRKAQIDDWMKHY